MIRNMFKLGITMALYAAAACVALAFVYEGTREQITLNETKALEAALFEIFPGADGFAPLEEVPQSPDKSVAFSSAWTLSQNGETRGIAIRTEAESYGGVLTCLVGLEMDKKLSGVRVLTNSDTPGLGANAASPTYYVDKSAKTTFFGQFAGKKAGDAFAVKDDVVAITASTITSVAVAKSVKAAALAGSSWIDTREQEK